MRITFDFERNDWKYRPETELQIFTRWKSNYYRAQKVTDYNV